LLVLSITGFDPARDIGGSRLSQRKRIIRSFAKA
jgi:hypothetical protein